MGGGFRRFGFGGLVGGGFRRFGFRVWGFGVWRV